MKFTYLCLALVIALIATSAFADQALLKAKFSQLFAANGTDFSEELKDELCKFDANMNGFKGDDWTGVDPSDPTHYKYVLSFCSKAKEAACAEVDGSLCQYDTTREDFFEASLASFILEPLPTFAYIDPQDTKAGFQLNFLNGQKCWDSWMTKDRSVTMKFTCDSGKGERKFNIVEPEECMYEIDIASKYACSGGGGSDGLSGGAIFLIIVLSTALVYTLTGCIICVAKFGKPIGIEACPHKAFWCALPGFFVAGIKFTIGKISGCFGSKTITTSSGEYEEA